MNKIIVLSASLLLMISCTDTKKSTNEVLQEIAQPKEMSERIMPHFMDMNEDMYQFDKDTYALIDTFLLYTVEANNDWEKLKSGSDLFFSFSRKIENIAEDMGNLSHDSHSILMEYSHPLRELLEETAASQDYAEFEIKITELQKYLLNFRQLFPEK